MDSRELCILQEAYMKVVENQQLDEISVELARRAKEERWDRTGAAMEKDRREGRKKPSPEFQASYKKAQNTQRRYEKKLNKEQVDIYDIILSHLLDERYADCLGSAEIILENMSDEWLYDILGEELTGDRRQRAMKKGYSHLATAREGSNVTKNRNKNLPSRRGGYGIRGGTKAEMYPNPNRTDSDRPKTPSGGYRPIVQKPNVKGNRARRRAGLEVPDNTDRHYRNDKELDF